MKNHRLEIYLDSYNTEPFIAEIKASELTAAGLNGEEPLENSICEWLRSRTGKPIDLAKQLRIEDVGHPRMAQHFEATRLRIKLV